MYGVEIWIMDRQPGDAGGHGVTDCAKATVPTGPDVGTAVKIPGDNGGGDGGWPGKVPLRRSMLKRTRSASATV